MTIINPIKLLVRINCHNGIKFQGDTVSSSKIILCILLSLIG